jgi:hypothetical protein
MQGRVAPGRRRNEKATGRAQSPRSGGVVATKGAGQGLMLFQTAVNDRQRNGVVNTQFLSVDSPAPMFRAYSAIPRPALPLNYYANKLCT